MFWKDDLVRTPWEGLPKIASGGCDLAYLHSLRSSGGGPSIRGGSFLGSNESGLS